MNCFKNPRRAPKLVAAANSYSAAVNVNFTIIANLLNVLREDYPKDFGKTGLNRFLDDFIATTGYVGKGDDEELSEYRFRRFMEDAPYVTWEQADRVLDELPKCAKERDRYVLMIPGYRQAIRENIMILFMTLHYDLGFGRVRMERTLEHWLNSRVTEPEEWLAKYAGFKFDPDEDRREIENRLLTRRNKDKTTLREQLDARRHMEALRAYQSEVRSHDKLAGTGTP